MSKNSVLDIVRLVAGEFGDIPDDEVQKWIDFCAPMVSRKRFSNLYEQALAFLTAHNMKLSSVGQVQGDDPLAEVAEIGVAGLMRVGSYSEGGTSLSFNTNVSQYTMTDAELSLTPYGMRFLSIRRMRILPIVSAGEPVGRA